MAKNPHAVSGGGTPRNPFLYNSLASYHAGVASDPFSMHMLSPEVRERIEQARAKILDAWGPALNTAILNLLEKEDAEVPPAPAK